MLSRPAALALLMILLYLARKLQHAIFAAPD
jgi:hypothetical protein